MRKSTWALPFLIFILLFQTSCVGRTKDMPDDLPGVDVPKEQINTKVVLFDHPGFGNNYKNGDLLGLGIKNQSEQAIIFPLDYSLKIYSNRDGGWELVDNEYHYPEGDNRLSTKVVDPTGLVINLVPWIPDLTTKQNIRIFVVGHIENKPTEKLAAYINLSINP